MSSRTPTTVIFDRLLDRIDAFFRNLFPCRHERLCPRFRLEGEIGVFYDECIDCGQELYD